MKILIICTFYAMSFQGRLTSSGTRFSQYEYTCATRLMTSHLIKYYNLQKQFGYLNF